MSKLVILSVFLFLQTDVFNSLLLLQGTWQMKTSRGSIYEQWKQVNDSTMNGNSYRLQGNDTILLERIQIKSDSHGIYYIPTVQDQNDRKPVVFTLIEHDANRFVFENKQHDFPQRIIYRFVASDSVVARIEGTKDGKERFSEFYYKKLEH